MGIMDKMKNLFTEEVEEEPIKSETIQVEIPAPEVKKEVSNDYISDTQAIKIEDKTPVFFDDDDFRELEKPKEIKSSYIKEKPTPVVKKEEKRRFSPTPIISPVYGVLDKNYHKEDITDKSANRSLYDTVTLNVDDVRKKAYGTLEDDLEVTLFGANSILFNDEVIEEEPVVEDNILLDDLTDVIDLDEDVTSVVDEEKLETEDLLDLIDSMYERGE